MPTDPSRTPDASVPPANDDASTGGSGAPPPTHSANRAPKGLTREYATGEIRVLWFASRCIHSAACIRALPRVFDPRRRPWVDVAAEDADAVAEAVMQCPTGALQYERADGASSEDVPMPVALIVNPDGPYFVRGSIDVVDEEGRLIRRDTRLALCRCGQSKHMPLCDNTHRSIGFRAVSNSE